MFFLMRPLHSNEGYKLSTPSLMSPHTYGPYSSHLLTVHYKSNVHLANFTCIQQKSKPTVSHRRAALLRVPIASAAPLLLLFCKVLTTGSVAVSIMQLTCGCRPWCRADHLVNPFALHRNVSLWPRLWERMCHSAQLTPQPSITVLKRQQQRGGLNKVLQSEPEPGRFPGE
ncbi:unnamed protein product [Pleuronectes platessa]|uniref:Uncharacterized protein n=1 Tax=Pleuronectes platessa TaxID=8262 RepID=A0A9N7UC10_PLEPL|nr:unnamed protein product [Pleuronectes platessa]